jgi:signal transduction histidine kinase
LQGFTELLLSRKVPPDVQRNWLNLMNEESTRLARLIEELLDLTRIESGRVALKPERVSVHDLVRRVVTLMQTHASAPRFEVSVSDDLPEITADPGKLTQVLANLLSNAIKYVPPGSCVRIKARRACLALPGAEHLGSLPGDEGVACPAGVSVAVADEGMGIARKHLRRIFEPFYRVQENEGQGSSGTGLGLAIAKAVVERHGGRMWVESCPGKGSVFGFCLPLDAGPSQLRRTDGRSGNGISK